MGKTYCPSLGSLSVVFSTVEATLGSGSDAPAHSFKWLQMAQVLVNSASGVVPILPPSCKPGLELLAASLF